MRDFKNKGELYVDGDLVINDYSSFEHKPLVQCNVGELEKEYDHRVKLLEAERKSSSFEAKKKDALFL